VAYLPDLSEYNYLTEFARPGTKAVGWLDQGHDFLKTLPSEEILSRLWEFCKTSVARTRGIHPCPFCGEETGTEEQRGGERLLLGTAEIRVFSRDGSVYACPTLIYHYVAVHHYRPPTEFLKAMFEGAHPPSEEYFALLSGLNLEWESTPVGGQGYWNPASYDPKVDDQTPLIELMARSKSRK
jgi:hypothetical protein